MGPAGAKSGWMGEGGMGTLLEPSSPRLDPPPSPGQKSPWRRGHGRGRAAAPRRGWQRYEPETETYYKRWSRQYDNWEQYEGWWHYAPWMGEG